MLELDKQQQIRAQEVIPQGLENAVKRINGKRTLRRNVNNGYLIDTGIIQVVVAVTAILFAIREITTAPDPGTQAVIIFGGPIFFPVTPVDTLQRLVFLVTGVVSTLLYSVYVWEWVDRNVSARATTMPVWLRLIALLAHVLLLILVWLMAISQVMVMDVIYRQLP
ncbi:MAG: hypothetical protein M3437_14660 [Chloroflexota bacterium]|nr:hypothetical protein [Chloroflexota bacterium]MDQ5865566.1 hypothetical protein [Chloroflexota bacterium]